MATEIGKIIDLSFNKMKEYKFMDMSREQAEMVMRDYVAPACIAFSDASGKDFTIDEEVGIFKENLTEKEKDLLASYVAVAYIDANYKFTTETLQTFLTGTDFRAFGNKDVLNSVCNARDAFKAEIDRYTVRSSYRNENADLWSLHRRRGRRGGL